MPKDFSACSASSAFKRRIFSQALEADTRTFYDHKKRGSMKLSRGAFLSTAAAAGAGLMVCPTPAAPQVPRVGPRPLWDRFADLPRHFIFEYYPWYSASPWRHWDASDRRPPIDVASNYMPWLGAYDSRSTAVIERHARWIKQSGAGAINVSWWGRGSDVDRIVPALMDVMADYDIHVTFH